MWRELLVFLPLAVLTNTAFPMPFDPVLISYAAGHSPAEACLFAFLGSLCAGVGALFDARVLGRVREALRGDPDERRRACRRRFYLLTFTVALLPLPFSLVRFGLLRVRPEPLRYALAVVAGRFPRYVAIVFLWKQAAAPSWMGQALLPAALAVLVVQIWWTRRRPGGSDRLRVARCEET